MAGPFHGKNRTTVSSLFTRLILCLFAFALVASAAPVNFVLTGGTFNDGSTLSGTFTFDPATKLYTNINLVKTGGAFPAVTFTTVSYLVFLPSPFIDRK